MCNENDVVAIRETKFKDRQEHSIYFMSQNSRISGICVRFDRSPIPLDEVQPSVVDVPRSCGLPSVYTGVYARKIGQAYLLAADIAEAGWFEVLKIPTLTEYQDQQAELAQAALEENEAVQDGVEVAEAKS